MALALGATAIVIVALLWEIVVPHFERVRERRRANRRRVAGAGHDPGRERRAEQRARALLRSCVNEEEWAMYRDLGFIRVWGAGAGRRGVLRLPGLPAQADRRLRAPDRPPAQRVLRRVPRPDPAVRQLAAARVRRRPGQVDGADRRRGAPAGAVQPAHARPSGRSAPRATRPVAPAPVGARARAPPARREDAGWRRRAPERDGPQAQLARPHRGAGASSGPRLPEGDRLRRRGAVPADRRAWPRPGSRRCPATSTCGRWRRRSRTASAPRAAPRWSSTRWPSPTGSRWARRG